MANSSQDDYNCRVQQLREQEYPMLRGLCVLVLDFDIALLISQQIQHTLTMLEPPYLPNL